ncbi:FeS-binding protein [Desulfobacter hydrogenophilus]|uniref:4Fe-4S binding protein n=1 Tax=Desulfobacter hydrogenophilus TaxID=2291 RepID=A0A328FFV4_9BACT|nr:4Fe-4S binding protein [Desulfobacter hydrogenophilus]NDY73177.1 4Fe-4S binding protein [Desulfobacter hydrogenophilus]QBH12495.1 4Fe-4S binding protein [Desulfobacter hydrogenophilus]RAM03229.1 FeS-binding protein [Desulfobacter hydrogenophilus]
MKRKWSPRQWVQHLFLGIVLFSGIRFYLFVANLEKGIMPGFHRPDSVDAFLPISALLGLRHLISNQTIPAIHPAGLVIFLIVCGSALLVRRGFCAWVCPVGLLSDYLDTLNAKMFRHPPVMPRWLDLTLGIIKYVVAAFFIFQIFFVMPNAGVDGFLNSTANRFADIKMLWFFTHITPVALGVICVLVVLSLFFRRFWCRYLCPYGALLAVIGLFSPARVHRNPDRCVGCKKCDHHCPGLIAVSRKTTIRSPECLACLRCVSQCPEKGALSFSYFSGKTGISPEVMTGIFLVIFSLGIGAAMLTGHWQTHISADQYLAFTAQHRTAQAFNRRAALSQADAAEMQRIMIRMRKQKEKSLSAGLHEEARPTRADPSHDGKKRQGLGLH